MIAELDKGDFVGAGSLQLRLSIVSYHGGTFFESMWSSEGLPITELLDPNFFAAMNICNLASIDWCDIIADRQCSHHIAQNLVLLTLFTNHHAVLFVVIGSDTLMLLT